MATIDYHHTSKLGEGTFGQIKNVFDDDGNEWAVKLFGPDGYKCLDLGTLREISILTILRDLHPNIISIHDIIYKDSKIGMVMPKLYGNFEDIVNANNLHKIDKLRISYMLLDAVSFLHNMNIIHRDIKTSNILMNHNIEPVLADFSLAKVFDGNEKTSHTPGMGTPTYTSPEIVNGKMYTLVSDVWSLGVVFYELFSGKLLTQSKNKYAIEFLMTKMQNLNPDVQLTAVMKGMLKYESKDRMTCDEVMKLPIYINSFKPFKPNKTFNIVNVRPNNISTMANYYHSETKENIKYCQYISEKMFASEYYDISDVFTKKEVDEYINVELNIFKKMNYTLYIKF